MTSRYEVIIIGAGPAGLTAGIYAARDRFSTLIIEKTAVGGNIINAEEVDNYPGYPEGISGFDLTSKMHDQATQHGAETLSADVTGLTFSGSEILLQAGDDTLTARALIIASGTERIKLKVPGEAEFTGRGVSYCATCDGPFFKDKRVAVIGGGNAALYEALHLTKFASRVTLIHRRDAFRATRAVQERVAGNKNIEILLDTVVDSIAGESRVSHINLKNAKSDAASTLETDGVFVAAGLIPNTRFLQEKVKLDNKGSVIVDEKLESSVKGIFAAGDVRIHSIRQVVTAAGDGAHAAFHVREYLENAF